jgi:hypothetical protein
MDEREELKQELKAELQWVKYRQKMLDIIEEKLLQMREIVEQIEQGDFTPKELEVLNSKLNNLTEQVKAIDSESIRTEEKILE